MCFGKCHNFWYVMSLWWITLAIKKNVKKGNDLLKIKSSLFNNSKHSFETLKYIILYKIQIYLTLHKLYFGLWKLINHYD